MTVTVMILAVSRPFSMGLALIAASLYVWSELFSGVLYFCVGNTPVTEAYMDTYISIRSLKERSNLRVLFN